MCVYEIPNKRNLKIKPPLHDLVKKIGISCQGVISETTVVMKTRGSITNVGEERLLIYLSMM